MIPYKDVDGLRVFFIDPDVSRPEVCERLGAALAHLHEFDRRRYGQVHRYVGHVLVWPGHYNAYDMFGGVLFAAELAQDATNAEMIGTLVHEAVHLRMKRFGVRTTSDRDARIERRCVAEQVDCLLRCELIDAPTAVRIFEVLSTEWWSKEARRSDLAELMRRAGLPAWSARLVEPVRAGPQSKQ
jgi:hypothetical protein